MRYFAHLILLSLFSSGPILHAQPPNIYQILSQEREALQCRYDLIHQARKEICLSTYALKNDAIGFATLQLLIDAAERGVSVRLLLDDFDNHLPDCLLRYLEERGVHTKVFNIRNWLKFRTIIEHMHGKMLITDMHTLIVGGRNLAERYYLLDSTSNFLDREVYVVSDSAVQQAHRHFDVLWNNPKLSARKDGSLTDEKRLCWQGVLERAPDTVQKRLHLATVGKKKWDAGSKKAAQPVHFIHDNYTYKQRRKGRHQWRAHKDQQATDELIALVSKAQHTLDIENPYFVPTRRWRQALKQCLKRGVKIRLVTNSSYTNDLPIEEAVYLNRRARALRSGIEIWEYRGSKMLHTKAMVIDGHISTIGSYNLEKLSHKFNSEVMVWVDDPRIAKEHTLLMNSVLKISIQVGKKSKASNSDLPTPSKTQRKRHRKVKFLRFTLAPFLGIII
ncbi:MAG: phosphatidylserine/phosphatidylglycerophosphate/cardiolipin synthase family protein [Phycisphaerae bacterium]|nr:phosphatidylserine/phosphatidylglycerophosphate/cardiolipin synthase family protein [Saprospiraceae bacterium]